MKTIKHHNFFGYFGNAVDNLKTNSEYDDAKFLKLKSKLTMSSGKPTKTLVFLEQIHSADIFIIDQNTQLEWPLNLRKITGDAIITNQENIGIGVATADCRPLFLYDPITKTLAVI